MRLARLLVHLSHPHRVRVHCYGITSLTRSSSTRCIKTIILHHSHSSLHHSHASSLLPIMRSQSPCVHSPFNPCRSPVMCACVMLSWRHTGGRCRLTSHPSCKSVYLGRSARGSARSEHRMLGDATRGCSSTCSRCPTAMSCSGPIATWPRRG